MSEKNSIVNNEVKDSGSYELIRKRLLTSSEILQNKINHLNDIRKLEFGGLKNDIIGKINIRTDNNSIPVDMAQINDNVLFGYNIQIGLKTKINIEDVLSLYKIKEEDGIFNSELIPFENSFLNDENFINQFDRMYEYYSNVELIQITKKNKYLLIAFKIGKNKDDLKVFRFSLDKNVIYLDDNGKDDIIVQEQIDFIWNKVDNKSFINGKNPHVSILDKVFVETIGGDLTIKVENNTESGEGIYSEPVNDKNQSLTDAEYFYSELDSLIFLKILPYREKEFRYFIFNTITNDILKADLIEKSCKKLPEGHGVLFPNGYHLISGESKIFENETPDLMFFELIKSPNGEDYLYIFFDIEKDFYTLYSYNVIQKEISTPIHAHGYSLYNDGKLFVFRKSENQQPSRVHALRVWQTPFETQENFLNNNEKKEKNFLTNIGNNELVNAISDNFTLIKLINKKEVSNIIYEKIIKYTENILLTYHWLENDSVQNINETLKEIKIISNSIIDEFEKVKIIKEKSEEEIKKSDEMFKKIKNEANALISSNAASHIKILSDIKTFMGHLITIRDLRYIDLEKIKEIESDCVIVKDGISKKLISLLKNEKSFSYYKEKINEIDIEIDEINSSLNIKNIELEIEKMLSEVVIVNDEINDIDFENPIEKSNILNSLSEIFALFNRVKNKILKNKKNINIEEAKIEFSSQFKLLTQTISSAISMSDTIEKTDDNLSKVINQIDKLETKFSEYDEFLKDILEKREEINEIFENHKQKILNLFQKKVSNLTNAAEISLKSISKKTEKFNDVDKLNSYLSSDAMVLKLNNIIESIKNLGDITKSEDLIAKFKKIKDQAIRSLRDNNDIFEENGNVMKMGKHKFSVNKNDVDLTIIPKDGSLKAHLTSTDFYETILDEKINNLKDYWDLDLVSESDYVYRSEYLVYTLFNDIKNGNINYSLTDLNDLIENDKEFDLVKEYASKKYKEGYLSGIHDSDASKILRSLFFTFKNINTLSYPIKDRIMALICFNNEFSKNNFDLSLEKEIKRAKKLNNDFGMNELLKSIKVKLMEQFDYLNDNSVSYLIDLIENINFKEIEITSVSCNAFNAFDSFVISNDIDLLDQNDNITLKEINEVSYWVKAYIKKEKEENLLKFIDEISLLYILKKKTKFNILEKDVDLNITVNGLLGTHKKIENGKLEIFYEDFMKNCKFHNEIVVPNYNELTKLKKEITDIYREKLKVKEFKSNPLSSFVRNKLITESYFKIIGDNLAKQIGTYGNNKRTDLMGLLMLISPPGYGKTTLIEYIANKLGLVFVKINCPSLGHNVTSLDPNDAPDVTSREEIKKINLAFEIGNNVLLYLDDIQHTNPEFLQKFISLSDGTRKIDGVWNNKPKTYDMKSKKFAIVMAGNPYTESGDIFNIPDMLANRADTYNLGDILSDQKDVFELSYIENSLTANPILAPLATRNINDLYKIIDMIKNNEVKLDELDYNYSITEFEEIKSLLIKIYKIRDVILKVNKEYIKSASIDEKYRKEPSFKLQGSYRNMNKLVEKILPIMDDNDINNIIIDHYIGESQTLSSGSEENMLKLKEIIGSISDEELVRWNDIKKDFLKFKTMGDEDTDSIIKVANQLSLLNETIKNK